MTLLSLEVSQTACTYVWEFRSQYPSIVSAAARALQVRSVSDPKGTNPGTLLLETISAEQLVLEQSSHLLLAL